MPPAKDSPVAAIQRDEEAKLIHFGFEVDGVFHPFASERVGDYDERVEAAKDDES